MKSNAEILRNAAGIMKRQGHARFYLVGPNNEVCLMGAINQALTGRPTRWLSRADRLRDMVGIYLYRNKITTLGSPVAWNNQEATTGAQVISALRGTARASAARAR